MDNDHKVKPLHMFPKASAYVVRADIKKDFDSEPVYNKFFLKTKTLMVMKLQIFAIRKFLRWILIILV